MIGTTLAHYRITAALGAGGMGEVWRAEDTKLGREVALKVLPEEFAADPQRFERFEREAKVLASLNHPNIAHLYGLETVGVTPEKGRENSEFRIPNSELPTSEVTFLVMELVEGEDLSDRIARGPIPTDEAIPIATQIAEALEAAHEQGIVHRDLKPANIKLARDGSIKVLDFGLAKTWEKDQGDSSLSLSPTMTAHATAAGVILGTAAYMSPEQARGQQVDRRADIWAFGVVLWEMLTGHKLFAGETVSDVLADVLRAEIDLEALPDETPGAVQRMLRRCLERDPRARLRHIGDARLELLEPADESRVDSERIVRRGTPRWMWLALAAAAAVAAASTALYFGSSPVPRPVLRFDLAVDDVVAERNLLPSLSADGSMALWSSNGRLRVRALNSFETVELPGTDGALFPFWSPDGRYVGFVRDNQVWRSAVDGGPPVSIGSIPTQSMTGSGQGSWGSDGTILLAGSHIAGLLSLPESGGEAAVSLPLDKPAEADFHHVARLPGTDAVVVSVHGLGTFGFTLQLISNGERKILLGGPGQILGAPVFAPTGHLLYEQIGSGAGIWALPFSLDRLEADGAPFLVVPEGRMPSLGANGTLLFARARFLHDRNIAWVSADGGVEPLFDEAGPYAYPKLSPDHTKVAFQKTSVGGNTVWIHDLVRDTTTRLTKTPGINGAPQWTPDGENIFFTTDRTGGGWDIFSIPSDGSGEARLIHDSPSYSWPTAISSDGRFVLIDEMTPDRGDDVVRLDLEDGSVETIAGTRSRDAGGVLSPDDRWLAYYSDETGRFEVYLRPTDTAAGRIQVSNGGGSIPIWSPSGDRLFYRVEDRIMGVDVEMGGSEISVGEPGVVIEGAITTSLGFASTDIFDVAADGSRILLVINDPNADSAPRLSVIVNFLDELEALAEKAPK